MRPSIRCWANNDKNSILCPRSIKKQLPQDFYKPHNVQLITIRGKDIFLPGKHNGIFDGVKYRRGKKQRWLSYSLFKQNIKMSWEGKKLLNVKLKLDFYFNQRSLSIWGRFIITKHNRLFWQSNPFEEQKLFKPWKKRPPFRSGHSVGGEHKTPLECLKIQEFCRHQALASIMSRFESNALLPGWTYPFLEQNLPPPEKAQINTNWI